MCAPCTNDLGLAKIMCLTVPVCVLGEEGMFVTRLTGLAVRRLTLFYGDNLGVYSVKCLERHFVMAYFVRTRF